MHDVSTFAFTLREEGATSGYRVAAGADRLRTCVTFDEEETGDPASAIVPFSLGLPARPRVPVAALAPAYRPMAAYDDDEITNVEFAIPGR